MDVAIPLTISALAAAFWIWMFYDMANNYSLPPNERTIWLLAFVFLNVLAAGYYYFTTYRERH